MKKITVIASILASSQVVVADNLLDEYFNTPENGGTITYFESVSFGKSSKGSDFDMCDSYMNTRMPGDKITAITAYSGDERIKGLKIEYLYADDELVGKTTGSGTQKLLGGTEYIQGWRMYKKNADNISRIRLYVEDMHDGSTRELYFGSNNGWDKWQSYDLAVSTRSVVGFAGTASDSKIWSIYPCIGDRLELEEIGVDIHWDQISEHSGTQTYFGERLLQNSSSLQQGDSAEVWYIDGKSETDTWTETLGVSATAGVSLTESYKVGVPATVEQSGSITFSFSETFSASTTVGENVTNSTQTTIKEAMPANVPAYGLMLARMQVENSEVEVPYTTTVRNPHNNEEFEFKGVISGSDYSNGIKRWDEIGKTYPDRYEIYKSYEWVLDQYVLENVTIIDDPVVE
ncbi:hypothetical protein MED121_02480 [Marinomonas sp. MED121]|uniref:ETX/MTX2 family pore-forming toxin n=1 Tax=Marinomonas sp. MED121 TaxID=314277 RepID=UPI0000690B99|nr:ETX/MTX2 family pore-forming toxin [Marinomonas sp. MED121]EAQ66041.1 hypothetical protein MED121_02480 [Marinomonas sp. MED121]